MAFAPLAYVKEHPYQAGAIGVVALIAVYLVVASGSGNASSGTGATSLDPVAAQLQSQQATLAAQAAAQSNQISGQIQLLAQQGANDLAIATIQSHSAGELAGIAATTQSTHDILAQELGIYQIQGEVTQATLQAQVANNSITTQGLIQESQIAANQAIARINADTAITTNASNNATVVATNQIAGQTQQLIAQVVGQTQQQISTNQANVAIKQTQVAGEIAKSQQSGGIWGSIIGAVGGIVGALI